ncbi:MAG: hypothetical protein ACRCS9_07225 [Hyphomicrobium sp.]
MTPAPDARVGRMFSGDRFAALIALLTMWATYAFVFMKVLPLAGDQDVALALAVGGGLVLLFNTAAIIAMISHYSEDRANIYGLDLHYLDLMNKAKS